MARQVGLGPSGSALWGDGGPQLEYFEYVVYPWTPNLNVSLFPSRDLPPPPQHTHAFVPQADLFLGGKSWPQWLSSSVQ